MANLINPSSKLFVEVFRRSLTEQEAARYIAMSRSFLRQGRMNGDRENRTPTARVAPGSSASRVDARRGLPLGDIPPVQSGFASSRQSRRTQRPPAFLPAVR